MINIYKLKDFRFIKSLILVFLLVAGLGAFASETETEDHGSKKKEYNAGEAIIEHIVDSYSWHILDYGEHSIAIPLPIILIDEGEFYCFSSAKFDHGHASYKGFEIAHDGPKKGKIIKVNHDAHAEQVAPLDFSITKIVVAIFMSLFLICVIFISVARSYKKRVGKSPKGMQSMVEPLILFIRDDIAKASIGKNHEKYVPFLLTVFFFIFINNMLGLIPFFPGGANVTGNIAVTMVLALFTFLITTFSANKNYWMHIVNTPGVPWWLKFPIPLMPVVELIGVFTKPFVLMVRLFANITAGHIIVLGFISLIFIFGNMSVGLGYGVSILSVAFATFMGLLELLVAFIQAYVFTLLSALYFGMATEEHH
jgi:F-type H+-transporting ATPase subunit a